MGGSLFGGDAPKPPDPWQTAAAQAGYNRLNIITPGARQVYGYMQDGKFVRGTPADPKNAQLAVRMVESPFLKAMRSMTEGGATDLVRSLISQGLPDRATPKDTSDFARSIYDRAYSLMSPAMDRARSDLMTNLQGRGLPVGSEAFNETYGNLAREQGETVSRLAMSADQAARAEQTRQYGLETDARTRALAELTGALTGQFRMPDTPLTAGTPSVDIASMIQSDYANRLAEWQRQQQSGLGLFGSLVGLGGSLLTGLPMFGGGGTGLGWGQAGPGMSRFQGVF